MFYEGRGGANGYACVQRVAGVRPDPARGGHSYAALEPASYLDFETLVPRLRRDGAPYETRLPRTGGLNASAVRRLTPADAAIVDAGLAVPDDADAHPREGPLHLADRAAPFDHPALAAERERTLSSRAIRDPAFARMVKRAYGGRCAMSGLRLRNGGGRAEVQAAHIVPVAEGGLDAVRNGLALSGTLHWMFDRGLVAVAEDLRLLVSHNKVDAETAARLLPGERRLMLPADPRHHPHPAALRWHREERFGRA